MIKPRELFLIIMQVRASDSLRAFQWSAQLGECEDSFLINTGLLKWNSLDIDCCLSSSLGMDLRLSLQACR